MLQETHAPRGGELGENNRRYRGGEFMPFYKPRNLMPQIDGATAYPALRLWLTDHAITFKQETVSPWSLRPHQRIDAARALAMPASVRSIPLLVSREGYILDGNHRWLNHVQAGDTCKVIRIGLAFDDAIRALFDFLSDDPSGHLAKELSVPTYSTVGDNH